MVRSGMLYVVSNVYSKVHSNIQRQNLHQLLTGRIRQDRDRASTRSGAGACRTPAVEPTGHEPHLAGSGTFRTRLQVDGSDDLEPFDLSSVGTCDAGLDSTHGLGRHPEGRFLQTPGRGVVSESGPAASQPRTYRARTGGEGTDAVQFGRHRLSV